MTSDVYIASECDCERCIHEEMCKWKEERHGQECAYMQEPKTGHWERTSIDLYVQHAMAYYQCSECGEKVIGEHNYCQFCGARMESEDKE